MHKNKRPNLCNIFCKIACNAWAVVVYFNHRKENKPHKGRKGGPAQTGTEGKTMIKLFTLYTNDGDGYEVRNVINFLDYVEDREILNKLIEDFKKLRECVPFKIVRIDVVDNYTDCDPIRIQTIDAYEISPIGDIEDTIILDHRRGSLFGEDDYYINIETDYIYKLIGDKLKD